MKCPHCTLGIFESLVRGQPFRTNDGQDWLTWAQICPECKKPIIFLEASKVIDNRGGSVGSTPRFMAYPQSAFLRPLPAEIPDPYRRDFDEAVAVLPLSPKASAALSRRNLQAIIRDKAGIRRKDLNAEIQAMIDSGTVPSFIIEGLDAVRNIGNFAAHPIKSTSTGEIVDVEPGEAEWDLDVLESMFDFYFVQPALTAKRRAALDAKLKDANRPQLK